MPQIEVTLPSGAAGTIRGLRGKELNLFANKAAAQAGKTSTQILQNVWVSTASPGPLYSDTVDWANAPQCDRFTALFWARIATFGHEYNFYHSCEACERQFEWQLDLRDVSVKPLPEASVAKFKDGNKFTGSVLAPDGSLKSLVFQLLTPQLEGKIDQAQRLAPAEKATASLAQRIVSVEGLEDGKAAIKHFLEDLDAGAMYDLVDLMEEADGGVQTAIEVCCPHCGFVGDTELPLGREFWARRKQKPSTSTSGT